MPMRDAPSADMLQAECSPCLFPESKGKDEEFVNAAFSESMGASCHVLLITLFPMRLRLDTKLIPSSLPTLSRQLA
jgi:hypothetical protein